MTRPRGQVVTARHLPLRCGHPHDGPIAIRGIQVGVDLFDHPEPTVTEQLGELRASPIVCPRFALGLEDRSMTLAHVLDGVILANLVLQLVLKELQLALSIIR